MATDWDAIIARTEERILEHLEAGAVQEYTIRGRTRILTPLGELRKTLNWAKRMKAQAGGRGPFAYAVPTRAGGPP